MKNKTLDRGKKLDRRALHAINGGFGNVRCTNSSGYCVYSGPGCIEPECQLPEPLDPVE